MPVELPHNLREFSALGAMKRVSSLTCRVTHADSWSETHVSGGGGSTYQGTGRTEPVRSTVTKKDKLFAIDESGKEHSWTLSDSGIDARPGHVLSLVGLESGRDDPIVLAVNHNLERWVSFEDEVKGALQVSRWWLVPAWLFAFVSVPTAINEGSWLVFGVAVAPLLAMAGITGFRVNRFNARAPEIANALAAQEPKIPTTASDT